MERSSDVVIVGGGLSGRMAAMAAVDAGASVHLVSESESSVRLTSGLVDVLGYHPDTGDPLADPFEALSELPSNHPYSIVGESSIVDALDQLERTVGGSYSGFDTDRNGLAIGPLGIPFVAHAYPDAVSAGFLSRSGDVLLVDVEPLADFDAAMAAQNLRETGLPASVEHGTIDLSGAIAADADRLKLAHRFDREMAMDPSQRRLLPALIDALRETDIGADRIGLPAFLGVNRAQEVRSTIEDESAVSVFEIPTGQPSVLGLRLDRRLDDAISESHAMRSQGVRAVEARTNDGWIDAIQIEREVTTHWLQGSRFVLATGEFVGGGLQITEGDFLEPLFGCPVSWPGEQYQLTATDPFDEQPYMSAGVPVDDQLRPTDRNGSARFANLHAAGSILGGFDPVVEGSRAGVAAATGFAAGRRAAREALS